MAKIRHTCTFLKVASGMRKMKANIVAFESPVPKIYNILPPPRDLDEMLAILFTGPCKPTKKDFARTPLVGVGHRDAWHGTSPFISFLFLFKLFDTTG